MSEPKPDVLRAAIADRDAHPWRYYRFEWPDAQKWLDKQAETIRTLTAERDDLALCLDSCRDDRDGALIEWYASRDQLAALTPALRALREAAESVLKTNGGTTHTPYGEFVFVEAKSFDALERAVALIPEEPKP